MAQESAFAGHLARGERQTTPASTPAAPEVIHAQNSAIASTKRCCAENFISIRRLRGGATSTPAAHGGDGAQMAHQHATPATSRFICRCWRAAGQRGLQRATGRLVPGRARHQVLNARARLNKEARPLDRGGRVVETTRLFGRGIAAIEPQWIEQDWRSPAQKQMLDPHWEKRPPGSLRWSAPRCTASSSTTTAGWTLARWILRTARATSLRGRWCRAVGNAACRFGRQPEADRQVEELEHKSRRQDVLVDDELIYAFYDQHMPRDVQRRNFEAGTKTRAARPTA